jgi:pyruvate/2-oxoglutarate dehydrogenase complex dihydrolipoamide dehydrogenase (E3) component
MSASDHYQAIVIGSGQGGTPLCQALANYGLRTALVERAHVGGTCVNEGCTPTKTMVASGRVAYLARRGADYGVHTGSITIDMKRVRQRKRDIVNTFRNGNQANIENTPNLDFLFGEARFTDPHSIQVRMKDGSQRILTADKFFINAGCRASVPSLEGLQNVPYLDSTSIMELDVVPEHLLIIGGGYIGLEFGQLFRRFGSRVTIVQRGAQLLGREDTDVAAEVLSIMKQDGIELFFSAKVQRATKEGPQIKLTVLCGEDHGGETQTLAGSHILVATGRVPNSDTLNIAAAGIVADKRGFIQVNAKLETNVAGIYALGDIKGGPAFTHISYDDFRVIRTNLIEKGSASTDGRLVPYTVFIDPQLGRVGLTEAEARAQNRKIRVAKMPMNRVARAEEVDESRGFIKAVVDAESGQILGAVVLGLEGGEVMSMIELAMMGKLPYTVLHNAIFSHPNLSEALNNLFIESNFVS